MKKEGGYEDEVSSLKEDKKVSINEKESVTDNTTIGSKDINILLCCSGSVASIKIPELVVQLAQLGNVRVIATTRATHFLKEHQQREPSVWDEFISVGGFSLFVTDEDEWALWNKLGPRLKKKNLLFSFH